MNRVKPADSGETAWMRSVSEPSWQETRARGQPGRVRPVVTVAVYSSADVSLARHSGASRQPRPGLARATRCADGVLLEVYSPPRISRFFWSLAFLSASSSPSSTSAYAFSAV